MRRGCFLKEEKIRKGFWAEVAFRLKAGDSRKWATGSDSRGPREEAVAIIQTSKAEVWGQCGTTAVLDGEGGCGCVREREESLP